MVSDTTPVSDTKPKGVPGDVDEPPQTWFRAPRGNQVAQPFEPGFRAAEPGCVPSFWRLLALL